MEDNTLLIFFWIYDKWKIIRSFEGYRLSIDFGGINAVIFYLFTLYFVPGRPLFPLFRPLFLPLFPHIFLCLLYNLSPSLFRSLCSSHSSLSFFYFLSISFSISYLFLLFLCLSSYVFYSFTCFLLLCSLFSACSLFSFPSYFLLLIILLLPLAFEQSFLL